MSQNTTNTTAQPGAPPSRSLEFPGCFAEGETADDAMQALDQAAGAQGQPIPAPRRQQPGWLRRLRRLFG